MTARTLDNEIRVYSYYRDAELRGSNLLFRLLRIVDDPESQVSLSEHLADETRHAWLWTELIQKLGGTPLKVTDGYQVRLGRRTGIPRNVVDLFCLTIVVEQRALRRYNEHIKSPDTPPHALEVLKKVIEDEGWHIDWIRKKARELAEKAGEPNRVDESLARFREIDREVWAEMESMEASWA